MPAYSFKERFIPMILDGSKRQTIRGRRKHPPKVGQTAFNYFGMRTKHCKKLNEAEIKQVQSIRIDQDYVWIYPRALDEMELDLVINHHAHVSLPKPILVMEDEADEFAWDDGFRPDGSTRENPTGCFELMIRFWEKTHTLPWAGDLIKW